VKIYDRHGTPARGGRGLFAAALVDAFPHLPVEEEGRLADPQLRDNFVERVFAYRGLRSLFVARWTVGDLVRFHTAHKLLLLAHAPEAYRQLGRLVAGAGALSRRELERRYIECEITGPRSTASLRTLLSESVTPNTIEWYETAFKAAMGCRLLRRMPVWPGSVRRRPQSITRPHPGRTFRQAV
jgi:hypothetical protein